MSENSTVDVKSEKTEETVKAAPTVTPSPASDLKDIQGLLISGSFPGNMAPAVVKSYHLLEEMIKRVEGAAANAPKA